MATMTPERRVRIESLSDLPAAMEALYAARSTASPWTYRKDNGALIHTRTARGYDFVPGMEVEVSGYEVYYPVSVSHVPQDPILGPRPERTETAMWRAPEARELKATLDRLVNRFHLPNGGTLTARWGDRTVRFDSDGPTAIVARRLLGLDD